MAGRRREDVALPPGGWAWTGDWRVQVKAGVTDGEGWQYRQALQEGGWQGRRRLVVCVWGGGAGRWQGLVAGYACSAAGSGSWPGSTDRGLQTQSQSYLS